MSNWDEVAVKSFGLALVTNVSKADADKTSFQQFKNFQASIPGIGSALPGAGTAQLRVEGTLTNIPALPNGFTLEGDPFVFQSATPGNGSDCMIIFGSKGGRDRFYVWPDITTAGAWSTNTGTKVSSSYISWLELTEAVATTISSVTSSAILGDTIVLAAATGLDEVTNDYHKHWYAMVFQSNGTYRGSTYIHTWTAATRTAQTVFGVSPIANDIIVLMRFPIFKKVSTLTVHYQIDNLPYFVRHGQNVVVHTGAHAIDDGPDLWLGYIDRTYFGSASGASNLDFKGWHFDHAMPWEIKKSKTMNNFTAPSETDDPIPVSSTDYYVVHHNPLYDGIEEANIFYDADNTFTGNHAVANPTGSTRRFRNGDGTTNFSVNWAEDFDRNSQYATGSNFQSIISRRINKLRVYMAQADAVTGTSAFRPTTALYFVKELDIDDSGWVRDTVTGEFELDYTLYGRDWFAGQEFPFTTVNGYEIQKTGANADFEAYVAGRAFVAPIYDDTKKLHRSLFTPLRQSGESAPEVLPVRSRIDVLHAGVVKIVAVAEQNGKLIVLGREKLIVGTVTGVNAGTLDESFHKTGCIAARTVRNIENLLFFSSQEKMFEIFDGNHLAEESPAERIQDIWNGLTVAEKEAAFAGVHRDRREYWIAFSDSGVQRILVYSLKYGIIFEYDSDNTYIGFAEGVDGQLYGATASSIVELVSGTPTESLAITLESQVFNHDPAHYRRLRMAYLSPSLITVTTIDDDEISALREKDALLFLPQTNITEVDQSISMSTARAAWKLTRAASTDTTLQVDSITLSKTGKLNR